jgi:hypothetical protein
MPDVYQNTDTLSIAQLQEGVWSENERLNYNPLPEIIDVELPFHVRDYAFKAPHHWAQRTSLGELQVLLAQMTISQAETEAGIMKYKIELMRLSESYNNLVNKIAKTNWEYNDSYELFVTRQIIEKLKLTAKGIFAALDTGVDTVHHFDEVTEASTPKQVNAGMTNSVPAGVPILVVAKSSKHINLKWLKGLKTGVEITSLLADTSYSLAKDLVDQSHLRNNLWIGIRNDIRKFLADISNDKLEAINVMISAERTTEIGNKYQAKLQEGIRLIEERANWNKRLAASVQKSRYADMNLRVHHNEALRKYNSAFELAARYAYLAAKAYDYETNLDENDPASAQGLLTQIVRERSLGAFQDGKPVIGIQGLADQLARLKANYDAIKSPLGVNNPQGETGKISLRHELFRDKDDDANWRNALTGTIEPNLWDVWEFRQHCRPFQAYDPAVPQPGLVISFRTEIVAGNNLFGWPSGPWDHIYDPSSFATKIRSVGVEFPGYDVSQLVQTPRVYLIPVGQDIMTIPTSDSLQTRSWNIVNQRIPVPFPMTDSDFAKPNWRPAIDSLNGSFNDIIRHSSFRAYHNDTGDYVDDSQMTYDSRLVGRSIWNTQWMLIIPGIHLLGYDPDEGVTRFINSIDDIKLIFKTYSHSGG